MGDTLNLTIVLVLFGLLFIYLSFLTITIQTFYSINNAQCSPINLFIKSIGADDENNVDNFAHCVKTMN